MGHSTNEHGAHFVMGPTITIVSVDALSYSGTTWLNLVLGSHVRAFTLGPPARVMGLIKKDFQGANLVWGNKDEFWTDFGRSWDGRENFLVALARHRSASHIIFDNPGHDFATREMRHPDIKVKRLRYLRDARAITASYARKNPQTTYLQSILPSGWFYPSFMSIELPDKQDDQRVFYYERCLADPIAFLKEVGPFVGLDYDQSALRFWEWDHHITSGNQGTIALVKLAKGLPVGNFKDREFYAERLEALKQNPVGGFIDDRWKTQLTRLDRLHFDILMGEKHAELGYERDHFDDDELRKLIEQHSAVVSSGTSVDLPAGAIESYLRARTHPVPPRKTTILPTRLSRFVGAVNRKRQRAVDIVRQRGVMSVLRSLKGPATAQTSADLARARRKVQRVALSTIRDVVAESALPCPDTGTFYFDEVTPQLRARLRPYQVQPSKTTREQVEDYTNRNIFAAYGPQYSGKKPNRITCDAPQRYRDLIGGVLAIPGARFVTAHDMVKLKPGENEIICHIRHDCDGDIVAALQQARIEAEMGIATTFYILHTGLYYGDWDGRHHLRNEEMADVYIEMQELGHEVALHSDGLEIYQGRSTDGAQGLVAEIEWLRSKGLRITGSVTHNSFGVYGAENFAIFEGRPLGMKQEGGPRAVVHNGKVALLRQIDEKAIGLQYEGNDLLLQKDIAVQYYALRGANDWRYQVFNGSRLPKDPEKSSTAPNWYSQEQVVDHLAGSHRGVYALFAVHPEYYGLRGEPASPPAHDIDRPAARARCQLGWRAREPGAISLRSARKHGGSVEFQSISSINPLGFADVPLEFIADLDRRIVILGKDQIETDTICVECKVPQSIARISKRRLGSQIGATSLAGELAPAAVRLAWLDGIAEKLKPADVVLSVGLSDLVTEDREMLARIWGLEPALAEIALPAVLGAAAFQAIRETSTVGSDNPRIEGEPAALIRSIAGTGLHAAPEATLHNTRNRILEAVGHLATQGFKPILFVEDLGEPLGLRWLDLDAEQRVALDRATMELLEPIVRQTQCVLVNPYTTFMTYQGHAPTHCQSTNRWSIHGHTLAAEALLDSLCQP